MPSATERVATRVVELRQRCGLSQEALAERARVHRMTIQRLEQAAHPPGLDTLERIAKALGVTLAQLVQ
jgi:transcriptional regulator with XRE-family HTH domain